MHARTHTQCTYTSVLCSYKHSLPLNWIVYKTCVLSFEAADGCLSSLFKIWMYKNFADHFSDWIAKPLYVLSCRFVITTEIPFYCFCIEHYTNWRTNEPYGHVFTYLPVGLPEVRAKIWRIRSCCLRNSSTLCQPVFLSPVVFRGNKVNGSPRILMSTSYVLYFRLIYVNGYFQWMLTVGDKMRVD